ncbi:hypothetical protein EB796_023226 [Bugula neritina]|uniref:Uncharacterized protein n=1 Tax=Bugula neritina TaxID=10212 RepID=A0A7J7IX88_BUGNE|nr:hypothetical protein EB796_023226 [Bugula neritina]
MTELLANVPEISLPTSSWELLGDCFIARSTEITRTFSVTAAYVTVLTGRLASRLMELEYTSVQRANLTAKFDC